MRILAVNTMDRSGGAEKIASDLVSHFRQAGHSTTLAVGRQRGWIADILIPQERNYRPQNKFAPTPADKEKRDREYSQGIEDFKKGFYGREEYAKKKATARKFQNISKWDKQSNWKDKS